MNETTVIRHLGIDGDHCGAIVPDGYLVSNDTLAMLGNGDVKAGRRTLRLMLADEREHKPIVGPTARPTSVRIAIEADEPAIVDLLVMEVQEHGGDVAPVDEERILEHVKMGTRKRGGIVGVIDGLNRKPVGTIGLIPMQWWFSQGYFIQELWLFVHRDHRRSRHAADLISFGNWAADSWSRAYGSRVYTVSGVLTTKHAQEKMRLYRRLSNFHGGIFVYPEPGARSASKELF